MVNKVSPIYKNYDIWINICYQYLNQYFNQYLYQWYCTWADCGLWRHSNCKALMSAFNCIWHLAIEQQKTYVAITRPGFNLKGEDKNVWISSLKWEVSTYNVTCSTKQLTWLLLGWWNRSWGWRIPMIDRIMVGRMYKVSHAMHKVESTVSKMQW